MQWKGEVFFRLVGYAQKTYKIGINAASIPVDGPLARESSEYQSGLFRFLGAFSDPLRIAIRCHAQILASCKAHVAFGLANIGLSKLIKDALLGVSGPKQTR